MRTAWRVMLVSIAIGCIATGGFLVGRYFKADRCLGSGGHWNNEKNSCERSHAQRP